MDCSLSLTAVRKKEMFLYYSLLLTATGRKKQSTSWELLYLYYMQFNTQEKPLKKEKDYLHVAEIKSKIKHEEGCTVRNVMLHSLEIPSLYYPSL